jgi:hypothetical protein
MARPEAKPSFVYFSRLPLEMRIVIWEAAVPGPRIVEIRQKALQPIREIGIKGRRDALNRYHLSVNDRFLGIRSVCRPPQLLFVCKESHGVASKHYKRIFDRSASPPMTYFDFQRDILYLHHDLFLLDEYAKTFDTVDKTGELSYAMRTCTDVENIIQVENLALFVGGALSRTPFPRHLKNHISALLMVFRGIKTLTLVLQSFQARSRKDKSILCFMEPVDIDKGFRQFDEYLGLNGEYGDVPNIPDLDYPKLDEQTLEYIRQHRKTSWSKWNYEVPEQLPAINYQICVTEEIKARYETAKSNCEFLFEKRIAKLEDKDAEARTADAGGRWACLRSTKNAETRGDRAREGKEEEICDD